MVGDNAAAVAVLRNQIKVVILGNDVAVDECTCSDVFSIVCEESLACFGVDHDHLKSWTLLVVNLFGLFHKFVNEVLF